MAAFRNLENGLFLAALALVACTKEETDTTDTNDTDTEDTSPTYLDPYWFGIDFFFGYDSATDSVVAYSGTSDGVPFTQNPAIVVSLLEEGASDTQVGDEICTIITSQAGPIPAKTSFIDVSQTSNPVLKGFEIDWEQASVETDCEGLLDPDVWGEGLSNLESVQWAAGITAPIDTYLSQAIEDKVNDDSAADFANDWAPYLIGARPFFSTTGTIWNSNGNAPGNPKEFYYGFGSAVDGTFTVTLDAEGNPNPILVSDITDGTVPTGAYGAKYAFYLNFQAPLADGVLIAAPE